MLRRKPTSLKLQVEDLTEYTEHCKATEQENSKQQDDQKSITDSLLQSLRVATAVYKQANSKDRQAEINRRIGFEPRPITPETTSHYQNLH